MAPEREAYIEFLARCRQAFHPFAPIDLPDFFKGRKRHIELLESELQSRGRQVAIYGERGVGKTSLALLADFFANISDERTFAVRCQEHSTYETIFGTLLQEAGWGYLPNGIETEASRMGQFGLGPARASRGRSSRARQLAIEVTRSITTALLLDKFGAEPGLLIIDEYDRVTDPATHTKLAETLKHFSDAASKTKIIVVGVAETVVELVGQHQSLTRCLAQLKLDRMSRRELGEIIEEGERRTGAVFHDSLKRKIVSLSDGFPFYTHLLCGYCAEEAGKVLQHDPGAKVVIGEAEFWKALRTSIKMAEGSCHDDYQAAVITTKRKTEMFRHILWAVAYSEAIEVQVQEIAENIGILTSERPRTEGLSTYLGSLTRPEKRSVLTRVRQGYYKFTNPLMRAYVRLILEEHNIVEANGQMQFPWMRGA